MAHASEILYKVSNHGLSYREEPVSVLYTEYSREKGQPGINALNIAVDLLIDRARVSR
jgi:hypothetical protein